MKKESFFRKSTLKKRVSKSSRIKKGKPKLVSLVPSPKKTKFGMEMFIRSALKKRRLESPKKKKKIKNKNKILKNKKKF